MSKREFRTITSPVTVDAEKRTVSGYFARFNERSVDLGGFTEVVAPGAFSRSLQENPDVLALVDHDSRKLLGRTSSGTLQVWEDAHGLAFTVALPDTSYANDLRSLMERGDVSACSFGFSCNTDDWTKQKDGTVLRTLKDVRLYEGSVVSTPAYPSTSAQLRSYFPDGAPAIPELRDDPAMEPACDCDCEQCGEGNCAGCTGDPLCSVDDDPDSALEQNSIRHHIEMTLALRQRA